MPPNQETIILSDSVPIEKRPEFLSSLYLKRLADVGGKDLRDGWLIDEEDNLFVGDIFEIFRNHALRWEKINHGLPAWSVVDSSRPEGTTVDADEKSETGWLRLAHEVEQAEFEIFAEIWKMAKITAQADMSGEDFFTIAMDLAQESRLFQIVKKLVVERPDGRKKEIFPHISEVTAGIDKFEEIAPLRKSGEISAAQRRAEQRFVAVMHDIVNILLADNDWLQLHAHAAATFLYRFFVVKMKYEHEEAVRIVNVIGFHHLPEVTKIRHQSSDPDELLELQADNRVIDPQTAVKYYRQRVGGWEELGRLMRFCLVDVGSDLAGNKLVFRAEHVAALMGMIQLIEQYVVDRVNQSLDMEAVRVMSDMEIMAVAFLQIDTDSVELAPKMRHRLDKSRQIANKHVENVRSFLEELQQHPVFAHAIIDMLAA